MNHTTGKVIVVGATGYIGRPLFARASSIGPCLGTSTSGGQGMLALQLDHADAFDYSCIEPQDILLLTAAISAPDVCADRNDYARKVNVDGTAYFVERAMQRDGRVIFFSSDTVYGEVNHPFAEEQPLKPAGEYGKMKAEVERRFIGQPNFKSIRLSYVFSREDKFTCYVARCAVDGTEPEIFDPFDRAIIHRDDVIEGALNLAQGWNEFPMPTINFGGPDVISRLAFVHTLQQVALPSLRYRVTKPAPEFFLNRPRSIRMASHFLNSVLGHPPRTIADAARIEFNTR